MNKDYNKTKITRHLELLTQRKGTLSKRKRDTQTLPINRSKYILAGVRITQINHMEELQRTNRRR